MVWLGHMVHECKTTVVREHVFASTEQLFHFKRNSATNGIFDYIISQHYSVQLWSFELAIPFLSV